MGLAGSLVAMAAAGLEPPNHYFHSSAGSESLPARKLRLWGGGGGRREREGKGGRRRPHEPSPEARAKPHLARRLVDYVEERSPAHHQSRTPPPRGSSSAALFLSVNQTL